MKSLVAIFGLLFLSSISRANNGLGSLFVAGLIGGSVTTASQAERGRLPEDLKDWSDPKTQSTSRLAQQCGLLTEAKIVRTGRLNFLFLGVRNESKEDVFLKVDRAKAIFSGGRERFLLNPGYSPGSLEIRKGWYSWGFIAFPRKSDFHDQKDVEIHVPLQTSAGTECELLAKFNRNLDMPEDESSVIEAPSAIFSIGGGSLVARSGVLSSATHGEGGGLDLYFAGYREPRSGWYINLSVYNTGSVTDPTAFGNQSYTTSDLGDLSVGKSWRIFHNDVTTSYFNLGPTIGSVQATYASDQNKQDSIGGLGLSASYTLEWRYSREYFGFFGGDHSIGITVFGRYFPSFLVDRNNTIGAIGISFEFLRGGG